MGKGEQVGVLATGWWVGFCSEGCPRGRGTRRLTDPSSGLSLVFLSSLPSLLFLMGLPSVGWPLTLVSQPPTPGAERGARSQPPISAPKLLPDQRSTDAACDPTPAPPPRPPRHLTSWASRPLFSFRCSWGPWSGVLVGRDAVPLPAGPAACVLPAPVSRPAHAGTTGAWGLPAGATSLRMSRVLARLLAPFA